MKNKDIFQISNSFQPYAEPDPKKDWNAWYRWFQYHYYLPTHKRSVGFRNRPNPAPMNYTGQERVEHDHKEWSNANKLPAFE